MNTNTINIKDKKFWKKILGIAVGAFILFKIIQIIISSFWGINEIGHILESRKSYTTQYYVYLFEERTETSNNKLIGDVYVAEKNCEDYDDHTICYPRSILLETAYLPNEEELYFDECELNLDNNRNSCFDQNENKWFIEFHNEKIK